MNLDDVERFCYSLGLVMKDFPDDLILLAARSGNLSHLTAWLDAGNTPLTERMFDD